MSGTTPADPKPEPALPQAAAGETAQEQYVVPAGYTLHAENSAHILLPADNGAFLNPVQEFNRDLSVACIRTWGALAHAQRRARWERDAERRAAKRSKKARVDEGATEDVSMGAEGQAEGATSSKPKPEYKPTRFTILEALSATGLRSIRYAKEIPYVDHVIANDLSDTACEAMRRNVELNGLGEKEETVETAEGTVVKKIPAKVRVNEGDACALMYAHRSGRDRVDVVDLDPYGTAAPFIDGAVQAVNDGGLLCVTCTDLSVLATTNYPEKCYANYGGVPLKAEYCHEAALRLVLHSLATSAARYGRYIEPLLSLSIDFYVRLFVRVGTSALEVKKLPTNTATYYVCTSCQAPYEQPLGKMKTNVHEKSGAVNYVFRTHAGPPVGDKCPECESTLHLAGPMWSGPIHDTEFVSKVLEHVETNEGNYGTSPRMKGMLTVAKEELNVPFYFTPAQLSGVFHCQSPSLDSVASALLHAGHAVSRSHALPGSLKTTATRADVHDVFRCWIEKTPVRMDKLGEKSPARTLLAKAPRAAANFAHHPQSVSRAAGVKLVRYQQNPLPNWGPGSRAVAGSKRKRAAGDAAE
ncbi:N2,N2-dimethylguanosine tRNA methyltransferase [Phanerochaete sordida]|uniref:tRNA (guanine(26)-N(2))-dimethyltransferase n=1 Tax=Phanerochaete sordida TaxID=48140 RepID=A0A9P3LD22_9APHY|nr:N2,N2-dimethylguanosine tRNA methyltransferase [Phanerochaete sordida]